MFKSDCKMAYKTVYTLTELRYLWKSRGNKNYEMKHLNTSGNLINSITFRDIPNHREVSGKLVALPQEGEAYHWPRLMHESLAPLLDIVSINENVSIYITTISKRSLRDVTCEDGFLRDTNCFIRKKSYAEDVLWGLDYLHGKELCLMNLSEDNIYINDRDKAVIANFRSLVLTKRATKNHVSVPAIYRAPELDTAPSLESFDALKAEIWACGVMLLQIFTRYAIPATFAVINLPEFVEKLDHDVLVLANIGESVTIIDLSNFKKFVCLFLCLDPSSRAPVKTAAVNPFLKRNSNKHKELNSPKIRDTSLLPHSIDITQNFAEACMRKNEVNVSKSPLSDAMINREKLKRHSPSNKFINLQFLSICRPREEESILDDSLSSKQFNRNMQLIEKECITQVMNINKTQMQKIERNIQNIKVEESKPHQNICGISEEKNHFPIKACANVEKLQLESFANTSAQLNKTNDYLKIENCSLEKNSFRNDFSEASDDISNDTMHTNKFHTTKNLNESINCSYIKIGNGAYNKYSSIYACTKKWQTSDCERSYAIGTKTIYPTFNLNSQKYFGIFPNSTFPSLYRSPFRGSLYWNTTICRSVSSDDTHLKEARSNCFPKPSISDANNVQHTTSSILKWGYFSFPLDEITVGEGDRKRSPLKIYKEKYSGSLTNLYSERNIYSSNPLKISYFDIQKTEKTINFAYPNKLEFDRDGTTLSGETNRPISESNRMASCSNGTILRNNSTKNSNGNTQTGDTKLRLKNYNSNLLPEFIREIKEQDNECAIPGWLNLRENPISSVAKDFNEQNGIVQQQMSFLNPSFDKHKWNFEMKQAEDIELKTSEHKIKQDDITSQHLEFNDHIGVFERNLNSFTEISLFKELLEEKVETAIKKKHRKKSWLRHLCPGCKVYRE